MCCFSRYAGKRTGLLASLSAAQPQVGSGWYVQVFYNAFRPSQEAGLLSETDVFLEGTAEAQYEKDLKAFLKQSGGEVNLSILGSVKKPDLFPKSTKLKAFLQAHSSSFTVQGDKVLLK